MSFSPPSQPANQRPTYEGDELFVEEDYAGAAAVYSDAIKITSTTRHGHQNVRASSCTPSSTAPQRT
eukprot:COSAG05_NODE_23361_length_258_cov_0.981132_1_plen_66_part_10